MRFVKVLGKPQDLFSVNRSRISLNLIRRAGRHFSQWKGNVRVELTENSTRILQNTSQEKEMTQLPTFDPNVLVDKPDLLHQKLTSFIQDGFEKLQVIADFDTTLTKFQVNGKRGQSCHSLVKTHNDEINEKRRQLYHKFYPIEIDHSIPNDVKLKYMEEWWNTSHHYIVEGGYNFKDLQDSVNSANIALREETETIFEALQAHKVPVLIFSAGIADVIEEVLRQKLGHEHENVRVVSNKMEFDDFGKLIGFQGKLIHVLNKNEHALEMGENGGKTVLEFGLEKRENVILLGDHLGDLRMSDGLNYKNRIAIGFLNDNVDAQLEAYKDAFDIVILNDGSMATVKKLIQTMEK